MNGEQIGGVTQDDVLLGKVKPGRYPAKVTYDPMWVSRSEWDEVQRRLTAMEATDNLGTDRPYTLHERVKMLENDMQSISGWIDQTDTRLTAVENASPALLIDRRAEYAAESSSGDFLGRERFLEGHLIRLDREKSEAEESRDIWYEQCLKEGRDSIRLEEMFTAQSAKIAEQESIISDLRTQVSEKCGEIDLVRKHEQELAARLQHSEKFIDHQSAVIADLREKLEASRDSCPSNWTVDMIEKLQVDAKLGALVNNLPVGWNLSRHREGMWSCSLELDPENKGTPGVSCTPIKTYLEKCIGIAIELEAKRHE